MKKIFFILGLFVSFFVSCSQSPEQKADALIKDAVKKALYKPESYKPVETKVDSAFAPYDDPEFFQVLADYGNLYIAYQEVEMKAKSAKSTMAIYSGPYQSEFGRNQYQEAKEEYDEYSAQMENMQAKGEKLLQEIDKMAKSERKFIGFKAFHNFRADNNAGQTLIGNTVFYIDKDFKEITYSLELEEYNEIMKHIKEFKENYETNKNKN